MARRRRRYYKRSMFTNKHKQWFTGAVMMLVALQTGVYSKVRETLGI